MVKPHGAVYEYLARVFNGAFRPVPRSQTVGVGVVNQVGENPERAGLLFVNLGATTIFIMTDEQVSSTRGIRLIPNGGTVAFSVREDFVLSAYPWYAVGDGAGGTLFSLELVRDVAYPTEGE